MAITHISREALRVLDAHPTMRVHSVFTAAVNLRTGGRLLTCSTGGASAPNGIEMAPQDLAGLKAFHHASPAGRLRWTTCGITAESYGLTIRAAESITVFDPVLPMGSHREAAIADDLIAHLTRTGPRSGLGAQWSQLVDDPRFVDAVASLHEQRVDESVRYWLGRGPGLTPSGDDVLVGMLAALWFTGALGRSGLARVQRSLDVMALDRTTEISREHLHCACLGMATGPLRALLVALDRSDLTSALATVERLARYGHTSGMDCLLGALTVLHHLHRRQAEAAPPTLI